MSKTTFEKLGISYEERDGIFYPVLGAGTEQADIDTGKYGRMWIKYMKDEYPVRYRSLVRFAELEERAAEVNETAYELLDDIENSWLKKYKSKNPGSFMEQLQLRTQARMMAEEIVADRDVEIPGMEEDMLVERTAEAVVEPDANAEVMNPYNIQNEIGRQKEQTDSERK